MRGVIVKLTTAIGLLGALGSSVAVAATIEEEPFSRRVTRRFLMPLALALSSGRMEQQSDYSYF